MIRVYFPKPSPEARDLRHEGKLAVFVVFVARLDDEVAYIRTLEAENHALLTLRNVMRKGQGMYERSRGRASPASYTRAKEMLQDPFKGLATSKGSVDANADTRRHALLAAVGAEEALTRAMERRGLAQVSRGGGAAIELKNEGISPGECVDMAGQKETDAKHATFDLAGDEDIAAQKRARSKMTWDKRKKSVCGDGTGADYVKTVTTERGVKLPATYRSGHFDEWSAKGRMGLPLVGEAEPEHRVPDRKRFKHHSMTAAKPLDKLATDYERKARAQKKAEANSAEAGGEEPARKARYSAKKPGSRGVSGACTERNQISRANSQDPENWVPRDLVSGAYYSPARQEFFCRRLDAPEL
ncbi:hypothetical protein BJY52DRAFT_1219727 [Lactarius psammicola]|nr:hypothetical protein BJY52DRAFT_1219727 [Lactarius psammicola]